MVFETLDAIDPAFESAAIALLHGERDSRGYPDFDGILGGVVAYWDEVTGDQIVRGIVGWGGRGLRGDTERTAMRMLSGILASIVSARRERSASPRSSARCHSRAVADSSAPTASSPRSAAPPSSAPSAACGC